MFFPSKSVILGDLLGLQISRQSCLVSLNCSHSNITCLIVRIALLQSSQWGATSGTSSFIGYPWVNKVCPILTLFITTSSLVHSIYSSPLHLWSTVFIHRHFISGPQYLFIKTSSLVHSIYSSPLHKYSSGLSEANFAQYLPAHFLLYQHVMEPSIHL